MEIVSHLTHFPARSGSWTIPMRSNDVLCFYNCTSQNFSRRHFQRNFLIAQVGIDNQLNEIRWKTESFWMPAQKIDSVAPYNRCSYNLECQRTQPQCIHYCRRSKYQAGPSSLVYNHGRRHHRCYSYMWCAISWSHPGWIPFCISKDDIRPNETRLHSIVCLFQKKDRTLRRLQVHTTEPASTTWWNSNQNHRKRRRDSHHRQTPCVCQEHEDHCHRHGRIWPSVGNDILYNLACRHTWNTSACPGIGTYEQLHHFRTKLIGHNLQLRASPVCRAERSRITKMQQNNYHMHINIFCIFLKPFSWRYSTSIWYENHKDSSVACTYYL